MKSMLYFMHSYMNRNADNLIHSRNNYLFWSDVNSDRIWRAGLDGSNPRTLVTSGVPCVGMSTNINNTR